jgi:hypothetical protein
LVLKLLDINMNNQKKEFLLTKIVSTLGPASAKESIVEQLILEGGSPKLQEKYEAVLKMR